MNSDKYLYLLEQYENNIELIELLNEHYRTSEDISVMTEGVMSKVKEFFDGVIRAIMNFIEKIKRFFAVRKQLKSLKKELIDVLTGVDFVEESYLAEASYHDKVLKIKLPTKKLISSTVKITVSINDRSKGSVGEFRSLLEDADKFYKELIDRLPEGENKLKALIENTKNPEFKQKAFIEFSKEIISEWSVADKALHKDSGRLNISTAKEEIINDGSMFEEIEDTFSNIVKRLNTEGKQDCANLDNIHTILAKAVDSITSELDSTKAVVNKIKQNLRDDNKPTLIQQAVTAIMNISFDLVYYAKDLLVFTDSISIHAAFQYRHCFAELKRVTRYN